MRRLVLTLAVSCFAGCYPLAAGQAQPYYPYPPGYYAPYYPPQYYRPPPPPPTYYAPPPYTGPYYTVPPAYNSANCGTPYEPKPCYR